MDTSLKIVLNCSGLKNSLLVGSKKLNKVQLFNPNAHWSEGKGLRLAPLELGVLRGKELGCANVNVSRNFSFLREVIIWCEGNV